MGKVIVFSDLQAHTHKKYSRKTGSGFNSRLEVAIDVLSELREFALNQDIRDVFFCGDMFETNNRIPVTVINAVVSEFELWTEAGLRVLAIPGNHDHAVISGSVHAMSVLNLLPGFTIISDPSKFSYKLADGEILFVTALPYRRELSRPDEIAISRSIHPGYMTAKRIMLAHGNVETFCPQPFKAPEEDELTKGTTLEGWTPTGDFIRKAWLKGYDHAFVGHIHQPGQKVINGCPVVSPGCPYQEKASAISEQRGIYIWDSETNVSKFFAFRGLPEFKKIIVPITDDFSVPDDIQGNIALLTPENSTVPFESVRAARSALYAAGANYVDTRTPDDFIRPEKIEVRALADPTEGPISVLQRVVRDEMVKKRGCGKRSIYAAAKEVAKSIGITDETSAGIVQLGLVEGRNVLCYEHIEIDLANRGLTGVGGESLDISEADSNGTGKSSMVNLVSWVLFGETLNDIRADEIIRRSTKGCRALIKFRGSDGIEYEVFRTKNDHQFKSALHFHKVFSGHDLDSYAPPSIDPGEIDEIDLRGENKKETQEGIVQALGVSFEIFRSLVVLGQGGGFRFSELKDSARKHLLAEILGLSVYERLSVQARSMAKEAKEIASRAGDRVFVRSPHHKEAQESLENCEKKSCVWRQEQDQVIESIERQHEGALAEVQVKENETKETESHFGRDKKEIQKESKLYLDEVVRIRKTIRMLDREHEEKKECLREKSSEAYGKMLSYDLQQKQMKELLEKDNCPTCGQHIGFDVECNENDVKTDLQEAKEEWERRKEALSRLKFDRIDEKNALQREEKEHKEAIERLEKEKMHSEMILVNAKNATQAWLGAVRRAEEIHERLENERTRKNQWIGLSEKAKKSLENLELVLQEDQAEKIKQEVRMREFQVVSDAWGPKGARSLLLDAVVPKLNERLALYSDIICGQYLAIQIATTTKAKSGSKVREEITLRVQTLGGEVSFGSCSGGEKRRMDIPILFALQDVAAAYGRGLGVCFLDEAFENLDASGVEGLFALLEEVSSRPCTSSIFVVTHDVEVLSGFGQSITFRKQDGISSIV